MMFKYDRLKRPDREIRIAVLQPGNFDDPIVVQTCGYPGYEALSYVWGSENDPSHVTVNSQLNMGEVPITRNLYIALRHLRYQESPRYLWIDALCINQANDAEKSKQVAAMGTIFKAADRVTAWVGPKDSNSELAMGWFHAIGCNLDVDWKTDTMRLRGRGGLKELTVQQEQERTAFLDFIEGRGPFPWTDEQARAILSLLTRPYFGRAWVAQELRLARHVFFQCGEETIPEKYLWVFTMAFNRNFKVIEELSPPEIWYKVRRDIFILANARMQRTNETILTLRQNLGHLLCIDARDKIYSALGLMELSLKHLPIVPSYIQPTEQVYTDIARRTITEWSELEILNDCELSSRVLDIPSWVPDWSTPVLTTAMTTIWSACAYVACRPSFDDQGLQCTVPGVFKSRIVEIGNHAEIDFREQHDVFLEKVRSLRPTVESLNAAYLTGETLMEVYCRTLVYNSFRKLDYAKSLEVLGMVWGDDERKSEEVFSREVSGERSYFRQLPMRMRNRKLFSTSSGHLGLCPAGAKVDDIVCVLLGCRFPVVLRPTADHTYLVVGTCYVHGLMNGEAIYYNKNARTSPLDGLGSDTYPELFDTETGRSKYDVEVMLEKAGLRVDSKQREYPWTCSVSDETLLAAGIQVEDFFLV